jgi:hypothetical protein
MPTIAGGCCDQITLRATNPDFLATSFYALKVAGTYQATSTIFNNRQVVTDIGYSMFFLFFLFSLDAFSSKNEINYCRFLTK